MDDSFDLMKHIAAPGRASPAFANSVSGNTQKERTSEQGPNGTSSIWECLCAVNATLVLPAGTARVPYLPGAGCADGGNMPFSRR